MKKTIPISQIDQSVMRLCSEFADKAQKIYPDSYVYLFGSHVRGTATQSSDIDVAVVIDEVMGAVEHPERIMEATVELIRLASDYYPIEAHLVQAKHNVSGFVSTIYNTGIMLREPIPNTVNLR